MINLQNNTQSTPLAAQKRIAHLCRALAVALGLLLLAVDPQPASPAADFA
jgi:hypothetical protein